ncbi:MAG: hypothetical protein IT349_10770, partial [Candidatus Eisenbacteria bacterium]|nr:hypothetical protein [Candidatus Eisenbacteria bacterium]
LVALAVATAAGVASAATTPPSSWKLQLRSTTYHYETEEPNGASLDRVGAYQEFDAGGFNLANGRFAFRASGRFADDLSLKERVTDRSRLYTGHVDARLGAGLRAQVGRQFLQEGIAGLTLDGVRLSARPIDRTELRLWAGAPAPHSREFKLGDFDQEATLGARLLVAPIKQMRLSTSFAYRERGGAVAGRPLGVEGVLTPCKGMKATGRATYDLLTEGWEREEALCQYSVGEHLPMISAQVLDRRRVVDPLSWFSAFEQVERVRIGRLSVRQVVESGYGAEVEYFGSFVDDYTSARIGGAFLFPLGRIGYSARVGDSGEESRLIGEVRAPIRSWLALDGGVMVASYALLQDGLNSDDRELTTAYARARLTPMEGLGLSFEVQNVEDPRHEQDVRFLAGLDLSLGAGLSRNDLLRKGASR